MGYYITIIDADWIVPADKVDAAYEAVVNLNKRHDLKSGGSSYKTPVPEGSTSVSDRPDKWFSWMEWNYDEIYEDIGEVFYELGFTGAYLNPDDGFHLGESYDSKIGNEEHFLRAIAPFSAEGSFVDFQGEDDALFRYIVRDGELVEQVGSISWTDMPAPTSER